MGQGTIKNSPRVGSGVARFSTFTAAATVLIFAFLPDTLGSLTKELNVTEYNTIAAVGAAGLTAVVVYVREIAELLKKKLKWFPLA